MLHVSQSLTVVSLIAERMNVSVGGHYFWDDLFEFHPDHSGLITPNYKGRAACIRLDAILAWEKHTLKGKTMMWREPT